VVIETVFAMQGIGQLAWESISRKDFPVVQAVLLLVSMFYVWLTFASGPDQRVARPADSTR
jgi:peptide/nickel transport system permease protein